MRKREFVNDCYIEFKNRFWNSHVYIYMKKRLSRPSYDDLIMKDSLPLSFEVFDEASFCVVTDALSVFNDAGVTTLAIFKTRAKLIK